MSEELCASKFPNKFKSSKKRYVRKRRQSDSDDDENQDLIKESHEKLKEIQKLRKRTGGTNVITLASGQKVTKVEEVIADDPWKLKTGGLVDMKSMKGYAPTDSSYEVGTQFSKETHIRDEDDEMRKFIQTEMEKLKGGADETDDPQQQPMYLSPEDAALLSLPEHLRKSTFKKDQQMLSAQMLSGIPEVDLGIEAKIQNIERTEKAKQKLIEEAKIAENTVSRDTNLSSQYFQHARFKIENPTNVGREKGKSVDESNACKQGSCDERLNNVLKLKANDEKSLERFKEKIKL